MFSRIENTRKWFRIKKVVENVFEEANRLSTFRNVIIFLHNKIDDIIHYYIHIIQKTFFLLYKN